LSGNLKQGSSLEVDERKSALLSNAGAIAGIVSAIEGTLGPKGLNCMLVGRFGEITISNDGRAILERIEVSHPAARLLLQTAKAQDKEVGDGTTTACILASALISEGAGHILNGVPPAKVVEGIRAGVRQAVEALKGRSRKVESLNDPLLKQAALIAGREQEDIAELVIEGARIAGQKRLAQRGFRLADWVVAKEGAENEVLCGITLEKAPVNRQMPRSLSPVRILIIDDALEPEEMEEEALSTEAGFSRYRELQEAFRQGLMRLIAGKVNLVTAARGVSDIAEQMLTEAGVMLLRRVPSGDLAKAAEHTGARPVKRGWLTAGELNLESVTGEARRAYYDEKLEHLRITGGKGKRVATMLVGASTAEVRDERQRIAEDAACAVQQALLGGVVAGGGAAEMSIIPQVERLRGEMTGMSAYGVDCVIAALRRPLGQIAANAGFNPLEKVEQVRKASSNGKEALGIDCDRGEVCDMLACGIVDAANVKIEALKTAAETAEAVLRINTIIRKRDDSRPQGSAVEK
jgi:chaperonin GroEL (HSP60 family)